MPDLDPIKQIKSLNILAGPCAASPVDICMFNCTSQKARNYISLKTVFIQDLVPF